MLLDAHTADEQLNPAAPLAMLLDHFDLIVQTPADVDKLDAAILQLAVEGKLVAQDLRDEPASDLLNRMHKEQEEFVKQGIIEKQKKTPKIAADEIPYPIPFGWQWVRLPDVCHDWGQEKPKGRFTYIDISSIDNKAGVIGDDLQVLDPSEAPSRARKIVKVGSVLYSTVRPYLLNIAIVNDEYDPVPIASTGFAVMHPLSGLDGKYIFYYLRSNHFVRFVESQMVGMAYPAINDAKLSLGLFPLPPLAEQKRIVARVDELRRHTAALRAELAAAAQDAVTVNNAALNRLHTAADDDAFDAAWQTLRDAFDPLYSVPQNLTALRQTILQLAVQGKLVPQDPNDEPASELIQRIEAGRRLSVLKQSPSELPTGWTWSTIAEVASVMSGKRVTNGYKLLESPTPYIYVRVSDMKNGTIVDTDLRYISKEMHEKIAKYIIEENDLYLVIVGATIGKSGIVPAKFHGMNLTENAVRIIPFRVNRLYMKLLLAAPITQSQFQSKVNQQAQPKLAIQRIKSTFVPLPPLAEQERIVAKVDELLAQCDVLEAELAEAEAVRVRMVDAVLAGV